MRVLADADLAPFNTFHVSARARWLITLESVQDLLSLRSDPRWRDTPTLFLGGGSNVLIRRDFEGIVALVRLPGVRLLEGDGEHRHLYAAAGEDWHGLVRWSVERGYGGLENLSLIPGSVGAAPVQNIGAYGVELRERFLSLQAVNLATGRARRFNADDCRFGYRSSIFKTGERGAWIITGVTFRLPREPQPRLSYRGVAEELGGRAPTPVNISDAICRIRRRKLPDPELLGNAGSFFKNPTVPHRKLRELLDREPHLPHFDAADGNNKIPAAWLIEACGWKGHRRGDAGVAPGHALVLVNHGTATGAQLWELATDIRDSVAQRFGIQLEPEPLVI
jgi:UDP-N-acetylmuramate dehydrogenase